MSSDASTLPLRDAPFAGTGRFRRRAGALARADAETRRGVLALALIVAGSGWVVLLAANRPSLLSPTTHANFFPHWMAGPLGGLLPGVSGNGTTLRYLFTGAVILMYGGYALAIAYSGRLPARWTIGAILAVHAIFLLAPPMALTDVFNYINYGRMEVVHNLNPYTTIPILEPHTDPSFALSNWHQLLSPYGPLFTLLSFAVVPLGVAASFWALKVILAAVSLATLLLIWRCARLLGRDPVSAIVLVGLNPIVLVWGLGGDHNDFLMVFFIVLALYLMLLVRAVAGAGAGGAGAEVAGAGVAGAGVAGAGGAGAKGAGAEVAGAGGAGPKAEGAGGRAEGDSRAPQVAGPSSAALRLRDWVLPLSPAEIGAGAALVTAVAIKASAGILVPVVFAALLRTPRRLTQVVLGMALAGLVVAMISLVAFGLHIPDLNTQSRLVTNESVPNLIGLLIGAGGESEGVRLAMSGVLACALLACCVLAWRSREWLTASAWASVALLLTLSWVLPWYVLWVLPLAALSGSRRLRNVSLALGLYLIIAWAPASTLLWGAIGFHPEKTPLGRLHQRYVKELLN